MTVRVVIVDDEPLARQRLIRLMAEHTNYQVVYEAGNGQAALDWLRRFSADLVLLDIQMPGMTGLDVAAHLNAMTERSAPAIIFCTAYDEHALQAFKVDAIDYLLKPIRKEDLTHALGKAEPHHPVAEDPMCHGQRTHISARTHQGLKLIPLDDVDCFLADHKYTVVHSGDSEVLIDESLKQLEDEFEEQFLRIHRNALVAKNKIDRLETVDAVTHLIHLTGRGEGLSVSRRHLPKVRKLLRSM